MWDWFLQLFKRSDTVSLSADACIAELTTDLYMHRLAMQASINLIADTLARGEFKTYERGEEVKKDNYYALNVAPNQNRNAAAFWRDVIRRLVFHNRCLVVQVGPSFYVAESFKREQYALKENVYYEVSFDGYTLSDRFTEKEVFYFELHDRRIVELVDTICNSYAELISLGRQRYAKGSVRRGLLGIPTNYPQTEEAQDELDDLLERQFRSFFLAKGDAVVPLQHGTTYTEIKDPTSTRSSVEGRDIRHFVDDIFDFVAMAFRIPPQLLKGDVANTEKAVADFLMFCIQPIADLIATEINRKLYSKHAFLTDTYVRFDTSRLRVLDVEDVANALDLLLRIGAFTVDDCLEALGMAPLGGEIGQARWMTKNYELIDRVYEGGGGD